VAGSLDINNYHKYLIWKINGDNITKVKSSYRIKRHTDEPTILVSTKNKKWRYFKANQWLYLNEEKYKVLKLSNNSLLVLRLE
jgi:ABC-type lipoprotein release transport system permease subunit